MTQAALVYGFGSFFCNAQRAAKDIDILILHESIEPSSINFAIECKKVLRDRIHKADVVMLSKEEERELKFLDRSEATLLGHLTSDDFKNQINLLLIALPANK